METIMKRLIIMPAVLVAVSLSVAAAPAAGNHIVGESPRCIVDGDTAAFDIAAHSEVVTALHLPGRFKSGMRTRGWHRDFRLKEEDRTLYIRPRGKRPGAVLTLHIETVDPSWQITLFVHSTDSPQKALKMCRFVSRDVVTAERERIAAATQKARTEARIELGAKRRAERRVRQIATARQQLLIGGELLPAIGEMRGNSGGVHVEIGRGVWVDGEFWTKFSIYNTDWRPYHLANVQVTNKNGWIVPVEDIEVDRLAAVPPDATGAPAGLIAAVLPGHRAEGIMRLPDVAYGVEPQAINFRGSTGPHMLLTIAEEPVWIYVPKRQEEIEREKREKAARGWLSLQAQGLAGFLWLANPLETEKLDATSVIGLGVRFTYSVMSFLFFEAAAVGARSGESRFADVMFDGVQGDLLRSAKLGRMQGGFLMYFSDSSYRPFIRAGLGLQGASHTAELEVGGVRMPGPEVGFELNPLWFFGAGVDMRLGSHIVAGVGLSIEQLVGSSSRSIEAGVHLGYSWKP
jgi:hypothetical protein